jgi:hypothetical protein
MVFLVSHTKGCIVDLHTFLSKFMNAKIYFINKSKIDLTGFKYGIIHISNKYFKYGDFFVIKKVNDDIYTRFF